MLNQRKYSIALILLFLAVIVTALFNISLGSVQIPVSEVTSALLGFDVEKDTWKYIILNYRLPKAITAIVTGSGLAVSGLLMQTLFRNPLAGPYVLGLSSGASLGVAIILMGASVFGAAFASILLSEWSLVIASSLGSLLVMFAVILASVRLRDTMAILIIGLMFASLTAAIVSVLAYFSPASQLQQYVFWSYGSLGNLSWEEVYILAVFWLAGILISIASIKNLNSLLLGEQYARSLGTNIKRNRFMVIIATSLLAGSITAFAGPIAFVGLAVPHLVRQIIPSSNHITLVPAVIFGGAILMLICDTIAQLPGSEYSLPINAITSLIGAPVVIWLLVRKRKFNF
ncbi:iron ABC transporter permease [Gramella sp. GC03-9]|uniref:Iron ABC transporter permease n=1 Tax=Christiangramia oceanisediminis TaxID=2920386 RepID=A0A9X2KXJ7_9FLAO|nr:iron ABC transporter permease [Gramella oceanisediminis]MCP9200121.1 iron ABC transporter permease [Gramella oceanisediminis]